jgi:hypothetical protein
MSRRWHSDNINFDRAYREVVDSNNNTHGKLIKWQRHADLASNLMLYPACRSWDRTLFAAAIVIVSWQQQRQQQQQRYPLTVSANISGILSSTHGD